MKKLVFAMLAVFCVGCNQAAQDMHFGPGPNDEGSVGKVGECSSCGRIH